MAKHYVVYCYEHLQDGHEEGAKITSSIEEALGVMAKLRNGWTGYARQIKLFELGKEIKVKEEIAEEPQPSKKSTTFKLAE